LQSIAIFRQRKAGCPGVSEQNQIPVTEKLSIKNAIADLYFQEIKEAPNSTVYKTVSIKPKLIIRSSTQRKNNAV